MKSLLVVIVTLLLSSCASIKQREEYKKLVDSFTKKDYKGLIKDIGDKKLLTRPEDRYLKSIELGITYFRIGDYANALNFLNDAKQIASQLFTVRASKKIESFLLNDANDIYYPNPFELSIIRFYELMSHYMLSLDSTNNNRRFNKGAIETTLRDWHSYLDNMSSEKLGKAVFKGTILADVMGYIFHDYLGRRQDRTIVNNFKKVSKKNLKQKMGIYPSFNEKYKKFKDDFEKLPTLSNKNLMKNYLTKTETYKSVEKLIGHTRTNTYVIILNGLISPKTAKKFDFPLNFMSAVVPMRNKSDFISFSTRIMSLSAVTNPKISFELPKVVSSPQTNANRYTLNGFKPQKGSVAMVANFSEILGQIIDEESLSVRTKVGSKLVVKHLSLLAATYLTYKRISKQNEFFAYATAVGSYSIGNKALEHLEKADLRSWIGIHDKIEIIPLSLKAGKHNLVYQGKSYPIVKVGKSKQIVPLFIQ